MNPNIGKRAEKYSRQVTKEPSIIEYFVHSNTHHNIILKRDFLYIEDVKKAININTLAERITLKRWLLKQLKTESSERLIEELEKSKEKDRHRLQKKYKVRL